MHVVIIHSFVLLQIRVSGGQPSTTNNRIHRRMSDRISDTSLQHQFTDQWVSDYPTSQAHNGGQTSSRTTDYSLQRARESSGNPHGPRGTGSGSSRIRHYSSQSTYDRKLPRSTSEQVSLHKTTTSLGSLSRSGSNRSSFRSYEQSQFPPVLSYGEGHTPNSQSPDCSDSNIRYQ